MTIPRFTIPYIFWRPNKVYGTHKMCITGGALLAGEYLKGNRPPNYPVPAMIGPVLWVSYPDALEIIITDCDQAFDPRLCMAVMKPDRYVITDYPHNSLNYR